MKNYDNRLVTALIYITFVAVSLLAAFVLFQVLSANGYLEATIPGFIKEAKFGGAAAGFFMTLFFLVKRFDRSVQNEQSYIRGNVYLDGHPVEGALVFVEGLGVQRRSNETGWFEIEVKAASKWILHASYQDYSAEAVLKQAHENVRLTLRDGFKKKL